MKRNENPDVLKAIPLGGHGEIGKNSWIFEFKNEIIIVNFGFILPSHTQAGIDLILPSTTYLKENESKIKGLILPSAHDDSAGGVFYLLEKVKIPKIWGSKLALKILEKEVKNKLPEIEIIEPRKEIQVGEFKINPISSTYSLPDTYGLHIQTSAGSIVYTGSYKLDQTPPDGIVVDYYSYAQAGEDGVDLLISDGSEIETPGYSQTESKITRRFDEIFSESLSRIFIVSEACELHKFQILFDLAGKNKKKILLSGDHMINKIQGAIESGFIKVENDLFINEKKLSECKDKEIVILMSGKYGNYLSALMSLANETHKIKLKPNDTIVISANPIPGTTRVLAHTIDQLYVHKVQVIGGRGQGVHIPAHPPQEEAKFMLCTVKPRAFAPSHGEERQLVAYGSIAEMMGLNHNDIYILENGNVVEIRNKVARVSNKIPAESIYYNQAKGLDIDEITMKERQTLSTEGTVTVALTIDSDKNIIAGPEIVAEACSFAKGKDWRAFCLGTNELIKQAVKEGFEKDEKNLTDLKAIVRDTVNKYMLELISKRPLINVSIQEVNVVKK